MLKSPKDELILHIRRNLQKKKTNQSKLAAGMQVSQSYVSDLLKGRRGVTPSVASRITEALDLSEVDRRKMHLLGARASGWEV